MRMAYENDENNILISKSILGFSGELSENLILWDLIKFSHNEIYTHDDGQLQNTAIKMIFIKYIN